MQFVCVALQKDSDPIPTLAKCNKRFRIKRFSSFEEIAGSCFLTQPPSLSWVLNVVVPDQLALKYNITTSLRNKVSPSFIVSQAMAVAIGTREAMAVAITREASTSPTFYPHVN